MDKNIKKLLELLNSRIISEKQALLSDDPTSTCAANHRGSIRAYEDSIKLIREIIKEE